MSDTRGWPASAKSLIAAVVVGGVAAIGLQGPAVRAWTASDLVLVLALAVVVAVSESFQFELPYRKEKITFSVTDAVWTAALFLVPPSVLIVALAVGVVVAEVPRRYAPVKIAFNVGQLILGITAALLVYQAFGSPPVTEPLGWAAVAAGMAVFQIVNAVLIGAVISLIEGEPFWGVVLVTTGVLHWIGNLALGILGALLWTVEPLGLPLLVVPLVLAFMAYRGWMRSIEERDAMREMARTADAISRSGDLATRLAIPAGQEDPRLLASTLNLMLDRLDAAFQRERLFIRETSHELRTPIAICRGHLEVLGVDPIPGELQETVDLVMDELERMTRIVEDMNTLARMEDPASLRVERIDLDRLVSDVAAKASPLLDGRLQVTGGPGGHQLSGDPQRLTQALINLLGNARQHTPADTKIELRALPVDAGWRFEVSDHGPGLSPGDEESVFRPFCTGSSSTPGNGLGLAIVSGIARAHGGEAGVDNRPGEGATFWLRVPR
ncbi:hypothetical protein BH20ACT5_BH20ACT5_03640 [soil metagenome]